ncbi:hypothetical protein [Pedobacter sp. SL55]|uniref:hypothetical protein n=1 Tax=Pedobacter sp. SL55 TaxID=2995161 RepID=UPI0022708BD2|nr:hypothetical protein [Pedobacter sp. SL55]WAC42590.1 hypothetical protein OVA16_09610 [Pedobacter sp. SL55]
MKKISLMIMFLIGLYACKNKLNKTIEQPKHNVEKRSFDPVKDTLNTKVNNNYIEVKTWIDDFKNFRQAVYAKDKAKLKSYFRFPIVGDNSGICSLLSFNDVEIAKRKAKYVNPDLFYEEYLDEFSQIIFNADFVKTIMKIKTAQLFTKHHAETPQFIADGKHYQMIADYYYEEQTALYLNMNYGNNTLDESGEKISEGEYNVIYIFDVLDGKKNYFKKIELAG